MNNHWSEIAIGQKQDILLVGDLEKIQSKLKESNIQYTLKQISQSHHLRSQSMGFEIEYVNNNIQTFFAYFRTKKMSSFVGKLPFGINKDWTLRTAVLYFGEPQIKSKHMVEVIYENLGLGIVFQGTWSRDESVIDYCYFFQPSGQNICSSCKKKVQDFYWICQCHAVSYCGPKCKNNHLGLHQVICQKIDE